MHLSEVHEVLEAGVEVSLLGQAADLVEVGVVHVGKDTEDPLEDGADNISEVGWKGLPKALRKDSGIIQLQQSRIMVSHEHPPLALHENARFMLRNMPYMPEDTSACKS